MIHRESPLVRALRKVAEARDGDVVSFEVDELRAYEADLRRCAALRLPAEYAHAAARREAAATEERLVQEIATAVADEVDRREKMRNPYGVRVVPL